ncbi:MCE family protein [Aeromicrobium sp. 636]|uniref:MCE family protein n=1 Tax=Aeromicrobium senzhongii TaxID=2663859 RepID=A0A8I0EXX3_9ACTN|nr:MULTISPECIES: MCE family protein [Aeromicrobium]MBC9227674.1 MCE family protein [Aeromicrobium senzhongii]MCQ3999771.1 MCE family protein [Aeromicrobium sp. 636]
MARVSTLEKPAVVRALGVVMIGLIVACVFLTYAMFTKLFSDDVPVTIRSNGVGLQLNRNADVKLRGVIVGRVERISSEKGEAVIHLKIDPDQQSVIPSDVQAFVTPKTLFGEKFIDLQPVAQSSGTPIRAGDEIVQAALPTEVEKLLADLDPLLTALNPTDLSFVLTALSDALSGEGESVGQTLETLSAYMQKMTPLADDIVKDITLLGETADTYADAMPDIGQTLRNAVVTGNTLTARRAQLQTLFTETAAFATSAEQLVDRSGQDFITLSRDSQPTLDLLARYSPTIECVLKGIDRLKPAIDNTFRDKRAHVSIEFAARSPRTYAGGDSPRVPAASGGPSSVMPSCATLPKTPYSGKRPSPGMSDGLMGQLGVGDDLGKTSPLSTPSVAGPAGSEIERQQIQAIVASATGVEPGDVPDIAQPLFGPVLRGAEVSLG